MKNMLKTGVIVIVMSLAGCQLIGGASAEEQIAEMLGALRAARGLTIVLVEQNLDFVAGLSNRVLIIQKGEIVKSLDPGDLRDAEVIEEFVGVQAGS